jgi:hypothetical protein
MLRKLKLFPSSGGGWKHLLCWVPYKFSVIGVSSCLGTQQSRCHPPLTCLRNVVFPSYSEILTMDEVHKPSDSHRCSTSLCSRLYKRARYCFKNYFPLVKKLWNTKSQNRSGFVCIKISHSTLHCYLMFIHGSFFTLHYFNCLLIMEWSLTVLLQKRERERAERRRLCQLLKS